MGNGRTMRAWLLATASVLFAVCTGFGGAAAGAATPVGPARPIAVSVPPDPTPIAAGTSGTALIRVVNSGTASVDFVITPRRVVLGDDGRVTLTSQADPRWRGLVDFPSGAHTAAAQNYVNLAVTVHTPSTIAPDLYYIGFLVTPINSRVGNLQVINQIGSFITIDVPGPRDRHLRSTLKFPGIVFDSQASGTLTVANVGKAAARFWGETDTTSTPGRTVPTQDRFDKKLSPVGTRRSFAVTGKPAWPIGFVTITAHVIYPQRTESSTQEIITKKRVLVISPAAVAIAVGGLIAVLYWARRRRRKRRTGSRARRNAMRSGSKARVSARS